MKCTLIEGECLTRQFRYDDLWQRSVAAQFSTWMVGLGLGACVCLGMPFAEMKVCRLSGLNRKRKADVGSGETERAKARSYSLNWQLNLTVRTGRTGGRSNYTKL